MPKLARGCGPFIRSSVTLIRVYQKSARVARSSTLEEFDLMSSNRIEPRRAEQGRCWHHSKQNLQTRHYHMVLCSSLVRPHGQAAARKEVSTWFQRQHWKVRLPQDVCPLLQDVPIMLQNLKRWHRHQLFDLNNARNTARTLSPVLRQHK